MRLRRSGLVLPARRRTRRCALLDPRSESDAGAPGSESAGARSRRLAPSSLGRGGAGAGSICRASSLTLIRVTAKTAGRETVRLPFRRASLFGAGGRRVTASGKKPAVPRRGGLQRLQRRVHRDVRKEPALGAFDPGRLRRKNQLVCKARRPAGWPRAWLAATVTVAQVRASAPGGPGVTPVPAPGGNRATLLPAISAMLPAMRAAGPAPPGTQAEWLQPGLGRRF